MIKMYPSYAGKILHIDLTNKNIIMKRLSKELIRNYIGEKVLLHVFCMMKSKTK